MCTVNQLKCSYLKIDFLCMPYFGVHSHNYAYKSSIVARRMPSYTNYSQLLNWPIEEETANLLIYSCAVFLNNYVSC